MAATSNMFFYSLTVAPPSAVTTSIVGQFIGGKEQQVLTAHGSTLSLYRPLAEQGKLEKVLSHDTFSIVRKLAAFRLAGMSKGEFSSPSPPEKRIVIFEGGNRSAPPARCFSSKRAQSEDLLSELC